MRDYMIVEPDELYHSKGKWKEHKYIKKVGDRYIYPDDVDSKKASGTALRIAKKVVARYVNQKLGKTTGSKNSEGPIKKAKRYVDLTRKRVMARIG